MAKKDYISKELDKTTDTFVLYRIIGNDLYPRHKKGQAQENLQFILEHEPKLINCEKEWIVNRIIDKDEEFKILDLLRKHNQQFIHIPFLIEEYKEIGWDTECLPFPGYLASEKYEALDPELKDRLKAAIYRLKNNYVMNNNGARNLALRNGKPRAKWILPWDGNCFVTKEAWKQIRTDIELAPHFKYFIVPMARINNNNQLLESFTPDPVEEPQLIFRMDSIEEFNEEFCYGRRPKVELFWRLSIPGKWDNWKDDPWDQVRRNKSSEANQFGSAGWLARMFSGMKHLEQNTQVSFKKRGLSRIAAMISTLQNVDIKISQKNSKNSNGLSIYRYDVLSLEKNSYLSGKQIPPIEKLIVDAEEALSREPYSVTDKKTLSPSGNINDYWHPAPYWWPNPNNKDGLPYIKRDGQRIPGTQLYEPESDQYDRTRLQRVFDDSIILALAWYFTGKNKYAHHGARILKRFFVDPKTRMTPHLNYAQVRMGRNNNIGSGTGIIEMKDIYFYLDAVRLLKLAGSIQENTFSLFKNWLSTYLDWLIQSQQGKQERKKINNHGTYYDLQVAAIADFLDDHTLLFETLVRAQSRIPQQFRSDGLQPEEIKRKTSAHYCCFNLQGWINLAQIASRWGTDLYSFKASNGVSIIKGVEWFLSYSEKDWPYQQIDKFDTNRFLPIWFAIPQDSIKKPKSVQFSKSKYKVKPRFFPHDGVCPYWNLGLSKYK